MATTFGVSDCEENELGGIAKSVNQDDVFDHDWRKHLPDGVTVSSVVYKVVGSPTGAPTLSGEAVKPDGQWTQVTISGGTAGLECYIQAKATLSNGTVIPRNGLLTIHDDDAEPA